MKIKLGEIRDIVESYPYNRNSFRSVSGKVYGACNSGKIKAFQSGRCDGTLRQMQQEFKYASYRTNVSLFEIFIRSLSHEDMRQGNGKGPRRRPLRLSPRSTDTMR